MRAFRVVMGSSSPLGGARTAGTQDDVGISYNKDRGHRGIPREGAKQCVTRRGRLRLSGNHGARRGANLDERCSPTANKYRLAKQCPASVEASPEGVPMTGTIKRIVQDKGFGFVK